MHKECNEISALLTIGYQGALIDDFVATLKFEMVDVLIDIRDVPVSRKKGFSKKVLAEELKRTGINYVHLRNLGDPKPGRDAARRGDMTSFERIFRNHLAQDASQQALGVAVQIAAAKRAVLLCFESDHIHCHRSVVAEAMTKRGHFKVHHLKVIPGLCAGATRDQNVVESAYAFG